jgi:hypothetical protein
MWVRPDMPLNKDKAFVENSQGDLHEEMGDAFLSQRTPSFFLIFSSLRAISKDKFTIWHQHAIFLKEEHEEYFYYFL